MGLSINTNVMSLNAQRNLGNSQNDLAKSMQRLSSGLRINSAKDDAAGLGISDRMTSQIRGLNQAVRNSNDGISLAQTAEGALQESTNILQRMRELAVQSANDTNTESDRTSLQAEVSQLQEELDRISETTQFNGKNLLDGSQSDEGSFTFQVGANAGASQTISFGIGGAKTADLSAVGTNISAGTAAEGVDVSGTAIAADSLSINGELMGATDGTNSSLASAINTAAGSTVATVQNVQELDFAAVTLDGTSNQTEETTFSFADLDAGQSVEIDGRTVTATGGTLLAADVAAAFANTSDFTVASDVGNANISGNLTDYTSTDGLTFTSTTANSNIAVDLTATAASAADPTAPTPSITQGSAADAEVFKLNLTGGFDTADTVAFEGISVAAGGDDLTAIAMAAKFATDYNTDGSGTWTADASAGDGSVTFTAKTSETRVDIDAADFTVTVGTDNGAHTVDVPTTQGADDVTEEADVDFSGGLAEGQSFEIDGRTVTASTGDLTAAQVAAAFEDATDYSTAAASGDALISGNLTNYSAAAEGTSGVTTFTSTTANTNDTDVAVTASSVANPAAVVGTTVQGAAASVDGTYSISVDGNSIDIAAAAGTEVTAQEVVDAINDDATVGASFTAALTDDGKVQITNDSGAAFTLAESVDIDGDLTLDAASVGLAGTSDTATDYEGQVAISSTADVAIAEVTTGALASAGLASAGNATTTIDQVDISTREGATTAISSVDAALAQIDTIRGDLGAVQNRFESTISNLQNVSENLSAARSRILDADIAMETSAMTKQNILQQAGVSILAQANQAPQLALSLLG